MSPNPQQRQSPSPEEHFHLFEGIAMDVETDFLPPPEAPFLTIAMDILPHQLDCVAWNHHHQNDLFSFGSYEIDPNDSTKRRGKLYLATLAPLTPAGYRILQTIENLPGVLDLKWELEEGKRLVIATSAAVIIYELDEDEFRLSQVFRHPTEADMALYVQWMNSTDIIYSDSAGAITVLTTDPLKYHIDEESNELTGVTSSTIHSFFVWFVHYDPVAQLVYSGDDSGLLKAFHIDHLTLHSMHRRRQFETGITSILTKEDIVAVGCYDEKLRIFTRTLDVATKQVTLSAPLLEMDLKGTVWRTMWIPPLTAEAHDPEPDVYRMAVAAGRNGVHMITFNRPDWSWDTTFCCLDHKDSLAYGIDVKPNPEDRTYTVATCYFDSHVLHIFTMKP